MHGGTIAIVAESLFFAKNDMLQQHNTSPSGLNQIHALYWTVCAGQYDIILYYSILQSTVVQYCLLLVLGVISNPNQTHRIFGRISNNFDCPPALQVDTASLPRPSQPMRTTFFRCFASCTSSKNSYGMRKGLRKFMYSLESRCSSSGFLSIRPSREI